MGMGYFKKIDNPSPRPRAIITMHKHQLFNVKLQSAIVLSTSVDLSNNVGGKPKYWGTRGCNN